MTKTIFFSYTMRMGGAEKALVDLVNRLSEKHTGIYIVALTDGDLSTRIDKKVHYIPLIKRRNKSIFGFRYRLLMKLIRFFPSFVSGWIKKKLTISTGDTVISFLEGPTTKLCAYLPGRKIAWMHTDYSTNHWTDFVFKNKEEEAAVYSKFEKIVFVSNNGKKTFSKYFHPLEVKTTFCVVPNALDTDKVNTLGSDRLQFDGPDYGLKTIVSVGRIVPVKNVFLQLQAAKLLSQRDIKVNFVIVGDGPQLSELRKTVAEQKISRIYFAGFQDNPYPFIKKSDIFLSTSNAESYPLSIIEAMALGKPVICTPNAGSLEVTGDGKFASIVESNPSAVASEIERLLADSKEYSKLCKSAKEGANSLSYESTISKVERIVFC